MLGAPRLRSTARCSEPGHDGEPIARPGRERAPLPRSAQERQVATRFATAFAANDIDGVVALLTDDAWFTMPPVTLEYQGPVAIAAFLRDIAPGGAAAIPADPYAGQRPACVRVLPAGAVRRCSAGMG